MILTVSRIAGDLAYADAWLKEEIGGYLPNTTIADGYKVYERILNDFYDEMSTVSSEKPYMVGPGKSLLLQDDNLHIKISIRKSRGEL